MVVMDVLSLNLQDMAKQVTWMNAWKACSFLLAAHMIHIGLWAYTFPRSLCHAFDLRFDGRPYADTFVNERNTSGQDYDGEKKSSTAEPVKESENKSSEPGNFWPVLFAPREVGFGLLILVLGGIGDWRAVGIVVATVAGLLASTDGVVAGLYSKGGWEEAIKSHGLPGVVLGALAVPLIRS